MFWLPRQYGVSYPKDTVQGTREKGLKVGCSGGADRLLCWIVCAIYLENMLPLTVFPEIGKDY